MRSRRALTSPEKSLRSIAPSLSAVLSNAGAMIRRSQPASSGVRLRYGSLRPGDGFMQHAVCSTRKISVTETTPGSKLAHELSCRYWLYTSQNTT